MFKKSLLVAGLLLCACESDSDWQKYKATKRQEGFNECYKLCGARPVGVRWNEHNGALISCQCDYSIEGVDSHD